MAADWITSALGLLEELQPPPSLQYVLDGQLPPLH